MTDETRADARPEGNEVELLYHAPVTVTVDIERGCVVSVSVGDEFAEPDRDERGEAEALHDPSPEFVDRALAIAEDPLVEWPAWTFG